MLEQVFCQCGHRLGNGLVFANPAPTFAGKEAEFYLDNNPSMMFYFCPDCPKLGTALLQTYISN